MSTASQTTKTSTILSQNPTAGTTHILLAYVASFVSKNVGWKVEALAQLPSLLLVEIIQVFLKIRVVFYAEILGSHTPKTTPRMQFTRQQSSI